MNFKDKNERKGEMTDWPTAHANEINGMERSSPFI